MDGDGAMGSGRRPRIAISAGEPAGIGPDVVLAAAAHDWPAELVVIADRDMLAERAALLRISPTALQRLTIEHQPLAVPVTPGVGDPRNAPAVLRALQRGVEGCQRGEFDALVTAPVNKAVIADSGVPFSGHTEYLAALTRAPQVVMLLAAADLRVALATTHIPLAAVPKAVATAPLGAIMRILDRDLRDRFAIDEPRISVLGLNPHAGEAGHLGQEDDAIIAPAIAAAQNAGIKASGPWPADTAFNARLRERTDAYLAMYHDQGLPVLKFAGFGAAVNITLGLPIIRTSVDHGTAFDLAGRGSADNSSFDAALRMALQLAAKRRAA